MCTDNLKLQILFSIKTIFFYVNSKIQFLIHSTKLIFYKCLTSQFIFHLYLTFDEKIEIS